MKLSNLIDEDLRRVALLKTRKGTATSDAKRASQILRSRHITHGGFFGGKVHGAFNSTLDVNPAREYQSFEEIHGCSLEEYLEREKQRQRERKK